jgi:hypothetical protein
VKGPLLHESVRDFLAPRRAQVRVLAAQKQTDMQAKIVAQQQAILQNKIAGRSPSLWLGAPAASAAPREGAANSGRSSLM